jgi:hypothetical protein
MSEPANRKDGKNPPQKLGKWGSEKEMGNRYFFTGPVKIDNFFIN